jgi:hypothetical protein
MVVIACLPNGACFGLGFGESLVKLAVCEISGLSKLIMGSGSDDLSRGIAILRGRKSWYMHHYEIPLALTIVRNGYKSRVKPPDACPGRDISLVRYRSCRPSRGLGSLAYTGGVAESDEQLSSLDKYDESKSRPRVSELSCHREVDCELTERGEEAILRRLGNAELEERGGSQSE